MYSCIYDWAYNYLGRLKICRLIVHKTSISSQESILQLPHLAATASVPVVIAAAAKPRSSPAADLARVGAAVVAILAQGTSKVGRIGLRRADAVGAAVVDAGVAVAQGLVDTTAVGALSLGTDSGEGDKDGGKNVDHFD